MLTSMSSSVKRELTRMNILARWPTNSSGGWVGTVDRPASGMGYRRQHRAGVEGRDGKQVHRDLSRANRSRSESFADRNVEPEVDGRQQSRTVRNATGGLSTCRSCVLRYSVPEGPVLFRHLDE